MGIIDTHCHLNDEALIGEIDEILVECHNQGVDKMICVGYDLKSSIMAVELANQYEEIYAAVGIHPDSADEYSEEVEKELERLATENKKVVAIGEIGLDYYWDKASHDVQKDVFAKQIELARKLDLPIIVHNRDAMNDTREVTARYAPIKGVMHCYSGSVEMAEVFVKQGFHISLAGPVTFKNAREPKEVAIAVPSDRILVETDCPYLTPHPYRGKKNYPYFVRLVAEQVAELRGVTLKEFEEIETKNVMNLFRI